jgi:WD40 repeat protein
VRICRPATAPPRTAGTLAVILRRSRKFFFGKVAASVDTFRRAVIPGFNLPIFRSQALVRFVTRCCPHARASVTINLFQAAARVALGIFALLSVAECALAAEPVAIQATRVIQCGSGPDERPTVVTGVTVTPDGKTIAAATDDHRVTVWDAATGELKSKLEGHSDWVHSVVLSHDGKTLASGAGDHSLCVWSLGQQQPVFQVPACKNAVASVSMHPNDQQLAVVGFSSNLEIINTSTGQASQEMDAPCVDVRTVAFSPSGDRMAAAGRNGKIRVWNVSNGSGQHDIETGGRRVRALAFSPDGGRIAAAGNSPNIEIFDVASGKSIMSLSTRPAKVYSLSFIDSQHLATGGTDDRITLWDLDSKQADAQLVGHTGTVAAIACDSTGRILVSGSYDTTLRVWNLGDKQVPATAWRGKSAGAR